MSGIIGMYGLFTDEGGQQIQFKVSEPVGDQYLIQFFSQIDGRPTASRVVSEAFFAEGEINLYADPDEFGRAMRGDALAEYTAVHPAIQIDYIRQTLSGFYQAHAGKHGSIDNDILSSLHEAVHYGYQSARGFDPHVVKWSLKEPLIHPDLGKVFFLSAYEGQAWVYAENGPETVPVGSLARPEDIPPPDNLFYLKPQGEA